MTLTAIRTPEWVHARALIILAQYRKRRIFPCRMHRTGFLSLSVNLHWRLLSRNGGKDWQLMTHEKYNGMKDRK